MDYMIEEPFDPYDPSHQLERIDRELEEREPEEAPSQIESLPVWVFVVTTGSVLGFVLWKVWEVYAETG